MSREILFKAKYVDTGEWVEGSLVHYKAGKKHFIITDNDFQWGMYGSYSYDGDFTEIDETTICQYTGLTDKNGNKIWENDVIKTYNSSGIECHIEQIIWSDYGLNEGWCSKGIKSLMKYDKRVFNTGFGKSDARKCEVIGNIFDNPELLKGSEEE